MNQASQGGPSRRCGAVGSPAGPVLFRVWAPAARRVHLVLYEGGARRELEMQPESGGYHRHEVPDVPEGRRYAFRLDDGPERPDPCSLLQPDGPHRPSAVVRPGRFVWTDGDWRGVRREDLVFYELHVGTFSPEGTFDGAIPRLRDLRELGVTAVELMPVSQFPGARNWGYDGVLPYAAQNTYGGPAGLHRLVDACHAQGLAVFLDVVYNHLGPEGSYVREFGPYFTERYRTPWGSAVNYDDRGCDAVRDYVLDNARMWLEEFHVDGLRLDAVHAIYDLGARHILRAIEEVAEGVAARRGYPATIVAESDLNDPRLLARREHGGHALGAQWADDFHHAAHAFLTGEREGYYADFGEAGQLAHVFDCPFLYAWDYSPFRGRKHGAPPAGLAGDHFVVCLQNHDQVGNRARGDRLAALLGDPAKRRLAAGLLLLSPYLPLLFMGEEYGEENPFPFFCSFEDPALVEAVRDGRRREFEAFTWLGEVPDPQAESTYASAKLSWSWPEGTPRAGLRRLYRDLLRARREWPALRDFERRSASLVEGGGNVGPVLELVRGGGSLRAVFNLGGRTAWYPVMLGGKESILLRSEAPEYGGNRREAGATGEMSPFEFVVLGPPSWRTLPDR
ncbi:MAG: malto-oligosyltrehalose trehalohydrolase [Isosphaeraceae bacterium]